MQVLDFQTLDIITFPAEADGDMAAPTNKERIDKLDTRLGEIEIALAIKPPKPKSAFEIFRAELWQSIKNHKGTIFSIAAIIVAVLGWFGSGWFKYYLDHRNDGSASIADAEIEKRVMPTLTNVDHNVTEVQATLKTLQPFIEGLVRRDFEKIAALRPNEINARLPDVQHLVAVAKDQAVQVNPTSLSVLSQKLLTIQPRSPEFWKVSADLVSYKSLNTGTRQLLHANLPNCTDHDPTPDQVTKYTEKETSEKIEHSALVEFAHYEDCIVTLDSPSDDAKINSLLSHVIALVFRRCRIVYRGGPVNLIIKQQSSVVVQVPGQTPVPITIPPHRALDFEDCAFDFQFSETPHEAGQQLTEVFLRQSGKTLTFPQ